MYIEIKRDWHEYTMAGFHYNVWTKDYFSLFSPSVSLLKMSSHSLALHLVLSSSLRLFLQVHSYKSWPILSFCPDKLPTTHVPNSKEMSIKSRANGRSGTQQQRRQDWPLDEVTSPRVIACHVPHCFTFHIIAPSVFSFKVKPGWPRSLHSSCKERDN